MNYVNQVREHFKERQIFSVADLKAFLGKAKINKNYFYLLLHNLMKKKEIHRITKGFYTFQEDITVAGFAFSPFYYGLQEALSIRNLWEQETNPIIITPRKVRSGVREIMDANVIVRRIDRRMFFGFEFIKYSNYWIPVSGIEKTFIDFIYFKEQLPENALKEMKKRIKKKVLIKYLKKCPPYIRKQAKKYF